MNSKVSNFNFMMLDLLRGQLSDDEMLKILISFYLIGYLKESEKLDTLETLKYTGDSYELDSKIARVLDEIGLSHPILQKPLRDISAKVLMGKLKPDTLLRLVRTVFDVPFDKEDWKNAVEGLIQSLCEDSRTTSIISGSISLNKLGMEILNPVEGSFYDGTSGTNGTVIYANNYVKEKGGRLDLYAQEINSDAANIGLIRAFINGVEEMELYVGDTLIDPGFKDGGELKRFDSIMMEFPLGFGWRYDENEIMYDKYSRYIYGKPSRSSSEWLFISHMIKSLKVNGKGIAIVRSSSLFNKGTESIRKNIVKEDLIEAVIGLPGGLLPYTNIPVNMLVINKDKRNKNKILFINAEDMETAVTARRKKELTKESIAALANIYSEMKEVENISKLVDIDELESYFLTPNKYVFKAEVNTEDFGLVNINPNEVRLLENTQKFGKIASFYRGIGTSNCTLNEEDGEYKIINLSDVKDGKLLLDSVAKYDIESNSKIDSYTVREGDIIISAKGLAIKICIIPNHNEPLLISQNFIGIRLKKGYSPEFIKEYLESPLGKYLIESKQLGSTITMLNASDLKDIDVVALPENVQDEIIEPYQNKQAEIEKKIEQLQREATELKIDLYKQMGIKKTMEIAEVE